MKTYQVEDAHVGVDIFRRLRARGWLDAAGIDDLTTALRLVEALPFDYLRERGWSWLLDGDRLHETIGCSIVDTAHIVVLDALAKRDLSAARNAAETACRAAPYDDICRLDLVKVAATRGHDDAADEMLNDDVFNRTDDHLPPIGLPLRTSRIVRAQGRSSAPRTRSPSAAASRRWRDGRGVKGSSAPEPTARGSTAGGGCPAAAASATLDRRPDHAQEA